jgi:hypothetical protein
MHIDRDTGLGCLTTIGTVLLVGVFVSMFDNYLPDSLMHAAPLLFLIGTVVTIVLLLTNTGRNARRKVMPLLVKGLSPYRPREEELRQVLDHLRTFDFVVGSRIKPQALARALRGERSETEASHCAASGSGVAGVSLAAGALAATSQRFSNQAIETALTAGMVFHLALRQTGGFLRSLFSLLGVDCRDPDHTTLARRVRRLDELPVYSAAGSKPIQILVGRAAARCRGSG